MQDIFLYAVVVPVLPFALTTRTGVSPDDVQQWVSILLGTYAFGLLVFSPICGWLADQTSSRKLPFMLGLVALAGANFLLCFGASLHALLIGRLLQGMAAAVVWAVGYAMVPETVGQEKTGEAIGWVSLGLNAGVLVGPALGGWVFARAGYYAVFGMSFGLLAIDIVLRGVMIERKVALRLLSEIGEEDPESEVGRPHEESPLLQERSSKVVLKEEPTQKHPLPMVLFLQTPRFWSALWGIMALGIMITAFDGSLPLFVHRTFGWDSTGAGLVFLCIGIPTLLEPLFGRISDKYGAKWPGVVSFAGAFAPYVALRLVRDNSLDHKILLGAQLLIIGACLSLGMTPLTAEVSTIVHEIEERDQGYSVIEEQWLKLSDSRIVLLPSGA